MIDFTLHPKTVKQYMLLIYNIIILYCILHYIMILYYNIETYIYVNSDLCIMKL